MSNKDLQPHFTDLSKSGRVEIAGEAGLAAGGFVRKRKRARVGGQVIGKALGIPGGLKLDAGEGVADRLGLDNADGLLVGVQDVVCRAVAGPEGELANSDA